MFTPSFTPILTYFDGKGRAEVSRQMFTIAGVKFEDVRVSDAQWGQMLETQSTGTPFGQLPMLRISEDHVICQSNAIEYYIAKKYGFLGADVLEETRVQMISNCVNDTLEPLFQMVRMPQEQQKIARQTYQNEKVDFYLTNLTNILKENSKNSIMFTSNKISLADLRSILVFEFFDTIGITFNTNKYPELMRLRSHILSEPRLKAYMENRPKTMF